MGNDNKYGEEEMLNDIDVLIKKKVELENERDGLKAQLSGCRNYIEQVHREVDKKDKDIEWLKANVDEMRCNTKNLIKLFSDAESKHCDDKIDFAIGRLSILKLKLNEGGYIHDVGMLGVIDKEIFDLKRLKDGEE